MFSRLFGRTPSHHVPQELYGAVVAQSRLPVFFTSFGFEDSVTGRFDVLSLHLYLFSRRLVREDTSITNSLNQEVFDAFTADLDRSLRELGIGDTSVPKRKKRMIRSFYALVEEFSEPLDTANRQSLELAVSKRYAKENADFASDSLATYLLASAEKLDTVAKDDLLRGKIEFSDPSEFVQN